MLVSAESDAMAAGRTDLLCRINGLRGNVLARMGRVSEGVPPSARPSKPLCAPDAPTRRPRYSNGWPIRWSTPATTAAPPRPTTVRSSSAKRTTSGRPANCVGPAPPWCCSRCGRWDRAAGLCAAVRDDGAATDHARAVAAGVLGLIYAMRGQVKPARASLLDSRTTARRIGLVAMEILSTWGLALCDEADGRPERAVASYRHLVTRCQESEERHYCVPALQFAVARFAAAGPSPDLGAATALLADAAARTGQPEARAGFAYALGESAATGHRSAPAGGRDATSSAGRSTCCPASTCRSPISWYDTDSAWPEPDRPTVRPRCAKPSRRRPA